VQLSEDQAEAVSSIERFLRAPRSSLNRPYFTLHGLAGTGKTTILAQLARKTPGALLCAFTGKAASVLRKKVGLSVSTIHSAIYNFKGLVEDEFEKGKMNPIFENKDEPLPDHVIYLDESSMVGGYIARDLLNTGARIVACGDPGQLPPVRDSQFFMNADVLLEKIHRQALDSPIIRQAHQIRNEGSYEDDGAFRVISFAQPEDIVGADIVLCWRNTTRRKLNKRKRDLLGLTGLLRAGEPVMCLKNDHRLGLYNGAIYELDRDVDPQDPAIWLKLENREILVETATIEDQDPKFEEHRYDEDYLPFAPAYASTVHKAQGSEYPSVLVFDEAEKDWGTFMYTAVTRAVERCTVVRWR
jgi:exodeoxyribonuclease-5